MKMVTSCAGHPSDGLWLKKISVADYKNELGLALLSLFSVLDASHSVVL